MLRTPRIVLPAAAVALGALVVLVAASTATGRSQDKPKNTKEPSITYVYPIKVGTVLNGDKGTWNPKGSSYASQWLRCNDNGESCQKITNATGSKYTVVSADAKHTIRLDVTGNERGWHDDRPRERDERGPGQPERPERDGAAPGSPARRSSARR